MNCSVEGCSKGVAWSGMCNQHAKRMAAHGSPHVNNTLRTKQGPCPVIGCGTPIQKGDYCKKHYVQVWRTGSPKRIIALPYQWSKGQNGYMSGTVDGKRIYQHVYVAELALGRKLRGTEEVHHVNFDKTDNRPENLVICPDRAYHLLLHRRTDIFARKAAGLPFVARREDGFN